MKTILFSVCIAGLLLASGCARYRARPLKRLRHAEIQKEIPGQTVSLEQRALTKMECREYLDRDVIRQGYQPVHIEFTNNSKRQFNVSNECFSVPCAHWEEVARSVHTSTVGRAVGYGVVGVIIWPFIIPAIVDGIGSSEANRALDDDFAQKSFPQQLVRPYSIISGLIFVPVEEFHEDFTLSITDSKTGELFVLSPRKPCVKA